MPVRDSIVIPDAARLTVSLEPAQNAIHSLLLLIKLEHLSGLSDWVTDTAGALTPEARKRHNLVLIGFHYAVLPRQSWPSFPAYMDHLAALDSNALRDKMLAAYASFPPLAPAAGREYPDEPHPVDLEAIIKDVDSYLDFLRARFEAARIDEALEAEAYSYVVDPPAMQALIVSHLREMWDTYLGPEWERVEPMLREAVSAFRQIDLSDMDVLEAAQLITGQDLREEKWRKTFQQARQVIFVPSAHIGPYLGKSWADNILWVVFGARHPEGIHSHAPDLSRAEIVVNLSALADDNRLRILRRISDEGELSSQEIMASLGLSQSTASRHLKQLSATGYLSERRCNGAKCYTLNSHRIEDTLRAISLFLLKK
jgi:DNA-binding transcriptional ArsR family regulator